MSQEQLADAVGVTQQAVQKWETGHVPKHFRHYKKVCEALEIEPVDLLILDTRMLYDWLVLKFKTALLRDDTLEIARLSKQVLDWERFFTTGSFFTEDYDDTELAQSSEIEKAIAIMFKKPTRDD